MAPSDGHYRRGCEWWLNSAVSGVTVSDGTLHINRPGADQPAQVQAGDGRRILILQATGTMLRGIFLVQQEAVTVCRLGHTPIGAHRNAVQ